MKWIYCWKHNKSPLTGSSKVIQQLCHCGFKFCFAFQVKKSAVLYKHTESAKNSVEGTLAASWETPRQPKPIAASLRNGSESPDPSLTISLIKNKSFKSSDGEFSESKPGAGPTDGLIMLGF